MNIEKIREKPKEKLEDLLDEKRRRLVDLNLKLGVGELQDTSQIKKVKKEIARILTVLKE